MICIFGRLVEVRIRNPNKLPVVLIEVQTDLFAGQDDIVPYESLYA